MGKPFCSTCTSDPYSHGNLANHDETRTRKLLLHKDEVRRLMAKTQIKGHTLIPIRLYFKNGRVKCELAVAKGKQDWDKRETERRREADRELAPPSRQQTPHRAVIAIPGSSRLLPQEGSLTVSRSRCCIEKTNLPSFQLNDRQNLSCECESHESQGLAFQHFAACTVHLSASGTLNLR